ncbi:thioredoxin-like protein [Rhizodiscina lignyota]|uniref:Thioredoxin-like protein n=1 Tax=Rhizodiscina lignyota TaxID=1504668 RepID=A0A9P4MAC3_9PEZI|nr:thioredoxin-like protein [Rhizodiscina lignyota]
MGSIDEKIILYTNHRCPWAHRAHIALEELKLPFEEVIIDLDTPRKPEYLAINPRGLVPSIEYNGEIVYESAIVSWLLADAYPSHLVPASDTKGGPLRRARIAFFVDTFFSKFQSATMKIIGAKSDAEIESFIDAAVDQVVKELEPLSKDAKPFFGGSDKLTMAEVLTGPFVLRLVSLTKADVYPSRLGSSIAERAPSFWKWAEAVAKHPSVTSIYDEAKIIESTKKRIAKARAS